jgi:hypothetical protein
MGQFQMSAIRGKGIDAQTCLTCGNPEGIRMRSQGLQGIFKTDGQKTHGL